MDPLKDLNRPPKEQFEGIPKESEEEIKKKLQLLKTKIDKFKNKLIYKHEKSILGISILPPEKLQDIVERLRSEGIKNEDELKKRIKEEGERINVLILIDDQEITEKDPKKSFELLNKIEADSKKIAEEIDKKIRVQSMLMSELREACFDSKYEILNYLSFGGIVYDKRDVLQAIKVCEIHKSMVIKKFEKYVVSYVAVGSVFRGDATSHDIDVAVIIDDTDVKRMSRTELRDKLGSIIRAMGYQANDMAQAKKVFHVQVYILTDFWDGIRDATPVFFTFLRDGIPLYDKGIFMPQKLLLNMGRIKPSPEAIDMHMDVGERLLDRAKGKMLGIMIEDVYYAAMNPSQAALMFYGFPPSSPKETIKLTEEIFVKNEKILKHSDINTLKKAHQFYKDIEHGKIKEVTGKQIDSLMIEVADYVKKIKDLVTKLEKKSLKKKTADLTGSINNILIDLMKTENLSTDKAKLITNFSKLVKKGLFNKKDLDLLKKTFEELKKTSSKEALDKLRRQSSQVIKKVLEHIQRKRGLELERAKIRVKYGEKFGEVYLLEETAYLVDDIDAKEKKIRKAKIMPNGSLGKLQDSSLKELDGALVNVKVPKNVFIKEPIFENLKKVYGKDIEVMINY